MEDDRGEFHEHGPGGLQERVQGRVRGADMQVPPVDADEVGPFVGACDGVFDVVSEAAHGGNGAHELGTDSRTFSFLRF